MATLVVSNQSMVADRSYDHEPVILIFRWSINELCFVYIYIVYNILVPSLSNLSPGGPRGPCDYSNDEWWTGYIYQRSTKILKRHHFFFIVLLSKDCTFVLILPTLYWEYSSCQSVSKHATSLHGKGASPRAETWEKKVLVSALIN